MPASSATLALRSASTASTGGLAVNSWTSSAPTASAIAANTPISRTRSGSRPRRQNRRLRRSIG
ncbi:hypothetical protein QE363_001876 [Sphingomonas sp. SORGH_AS870]|uniref:hypothetical protein n=1 Tax=Sphingomonas sp. SORGH_AS_0870 TaxID=3041801 RepID=UPI0028596F1A|nr:hypothetical protein [Sphingomonas sp. SORGH_AS_0870]MDR6146083.1 hypothetical protein [Sphingomonas sp. SORGH_AS_0870]